MSGMVELRAERLVEAYGQHISELTKKKKRRREHYKHKNKVTMTDPIQFEFALLACANSDDCKVVHYSYLM